MKIPILDIATFCSKHHRLPDKDRLALWTFRVDGETLSFWGTPAQAASTASLYARMHALENAVFVLADYCPLPRVFTVSSFDN